jgi:hypothetical protein
VSIVEIVSFLLNNYNLCFVYAIYYVTEFTAQDWKQSKHGNTFKIKQI